MKLDRLLYTIFLIVFSGVAAWGVSQLPELQVDNLNINGNTISSTNTNGDITLTPNGTGDVILSPLSNGNRALVSGAGGEVTESAVTGTELGYVSGVTSALQTQLNAKIDDFSSTTDNALVRTDGTSGNAVQDSGVIVDDSDNITGVASLNAVTSTELSQLENIDATTISATQWGYLGVFDQNLRTTDTPTFDGVTLTNPMTLSHETTPANPSAGDLKVYAKNDDKLYTLNSAGTETEIGSGAGGGGLDTFYTENAETTNVADFTSGQNATFDNGGTLGGALADETSSPLNGDASFKYTMHATSASSDNDWIKGPAITLSSKQKGNTIGVTFYYTYSGDDDDIRFVCWDDTNNENLAIETAYLKTATTSKRFSIDCPIASSTATLNWGFFTVTGNSSKVLVWDDIEATTDPFVYKDLLDPEVKVTGAGNGGTSITANVTDVDFTETSDPSGAWNGTQFTAPMDGTYDIEGAIYNTSGTALIMYGYIDGVQDQVIGRTPSAYVYHKLSGQVYLEEGEVWSVRVHNNITLSNVAVRHWISITRVPTSTENIIGYTSKNAVNSMVRLQTGNGHGSTNTSIRRFTTTVKNTGSAVTYADSAADGASFTINEDGVYYISYNDSSASAADSFGISLNSSQLTTNINTITAADRLTYTDTAAADYVNVSAWSGTLEKGDVIRAHTSGSLNATGTASFTISKIGVGDLVGLPSHRTQTKILSSDFTTDATVISALTFSNLKTGQCYEVHGQASFVTTSTSVETIYLYTYEGSNLIGAPAANFSLPSGGGQITIPFKYDITATGTTVTFETQSLGASDHIEGDGTKVGTWATLTEKDCPITTTAW